MVLRGEACLIILISKFDTCKSEFDYDTDLVQLLRTTVVLLLDYLVPVKVCYGVVLV
jgi:hypothetical protein